MPAAFTSTFIGGVLKGMLGAPSTVFADRYLVKRWPAGSPPLVYYVRPGGSDSNDGKTPTKAFATFEHGLQQLSVAEVNHPVVLDITGMTVSANSILNLGGTTLGGIDNGFDMTAATAPNNFVSRRHRQIRSELVLQQPLNVSTQSFDMTDGFLTMHVADVLVPGNLRGKFAIGSEIGEWGVIVDNTADTVTVARLSALTEPIGVYKPGATLTFGDSADFQNQAIYLLALCDWGLQGLELRSQGKATALTIHPIAPVDLTLCHVQGLAIEDGGRVALDGVYVDGGTFSHSGGTVSAIQSFFRGSRLICHGSSASGLNEWIGVGFSGCSAFGAGNFESRYSFQMENCRISNSTAAGLAVLFGTSRARNTRIEGSAGPAVLAAGAHMLLDNVQGNGNARGVEARHGANVRLANGTAVTGAAGDVVVGALGARTYTQLPATDLDQLVRVGS